MNLLVCSFVIEYQRRTDHSSASASEDSWVLVNNNVRPRAGGDFAILDLSPETRYELKITAHNAAGSTVREYGFTTLTYAGGMEKKTP